MARERCGVVDRRTFLAALGGGVGIVTSACRNGGSGLEMLDKARFGAPPNPDVWWDVTGDVVIASENRSVTVNWTTVADVAYDAELNGAVIASDVVDGTFRLGFGDQAPGFTAGPNTLRVLARADGQTSPSRPLNFVVRSGGTMRARAFDLEDEAPIATTAPSVGAEIVVTPDAARGAGRGALLRSDGSDDGRAYKNLPHLPVRESWMRLSVQPISADATVASVGLGRIRASDANASENLMWVPGAGIRTTHMSQYVPAPLGGWTQVQFGVRGDGTVELWTFDDVRETLVATTRRAEFADAARDSAAVGNVFKADGSFEVLLDDIAVASTRLPWVQPAVESAPRRPIRVDPSKLPPTFSFVFGSCINANHVPYDSTALAAAVATEPDFFVHLGDHGYVDSSAWAQTLGGYHAFWNDLTCGEHMAELAMTPWIFICSDHDLGVNNATGVTMAPFASQAFATWQNNDPSTDGVGRCGSIALDGGRVLLMWLEGIIHRVALGVDGTALGEVQLDWLLSTLSSTPADLVMIATQTTVGHQSDTGWVVNPTERARILDTARACRAEVRFLSGDYHAARWADFGGGVAEWGAAPLAEFPQPPPSPAKDVVDHGWFTVGDFNSRPEALAGLSIDEFNSGGTFGRVVIDTTRRRATFELRDNNGNVRVDHLGRPMKETMTYGH